MSKISQLLVEVASIEASITEDMSKEVLYDSLVIAYTHLKDVIALQQGNIPLVKDNASEVALRDSQEQVRVLEAWKDGANLEGEQLTAELKSAMATISTLGKRLEVITADNSEGDLLRDKVASLTKELTTTTVLAEGRGRQIAAISTIIN